MQENNWLFILEICLVWQQLYTKFDAIYKGQLFFLVSHVYFLTLYTHTAFRFLAALWVRLIALNHEKN